MRTTYITFLSIFCFLFWLGCSEDTIDIERTGRLTGTITNKDTDAPLEGVKVTTNPASTTTLTDAEGKFVITEILVDDYSVQAELDNYQTAFEPVEVLEDETSTVIMEMEISKTSIDPPTVPELLNPIDNATDIPLEVTFTWSASESEIDELTYTFELRNGSTNDFESIEVVNDTIYTYSNLQPSTTFFWQVKVSDGENEEISSPLSSFTTADIPSNALLFVKNINGNSVIFSGSLPQETTDVDGNSQSDADNNVTKLTTENTNSFRPKKNQQVKKIAFLRSVNSETHLFTMDFDGTDIKQVTSQIPVAGFRMSEIDFTWANNGAQLFYPSLDKLYKVDNDGGGLRLVYQTPDGSLISEVSVPQFDNDLILLKTNNLQGYNARIFTYRISTSSEGNVILEGELGAVGGIDINANGDKVIFSRDISGAENSSYRRFESRLFIHDLQTLSTSQLTTDAVSGQIEYDCSFSPSEGGVIWVRRESNLNAIPAIYSLVFDENGSEILLFTASYMPDWK
jgi:hypothetical protein